MNTSIPRGSVEKSLPAAELTNRSGPGNTSPTEWGFLALLTAFAAVLRFHSLAARTFWFDEGASVGIARLDWYNFGRILWRREANMSLYYLLLRGWLHFGQSEFFIRSLSVLFALATISAIYFLGRRLFGSRIGLIAAILLTVNAYHVRYSQEARSYSLMVLLCVLSSLYFLKCFDLPSRRNRALYILLSSAAIYAHFYSALLVIAQCLSLLFLDQQSIPRQIRKDWRWIAFLASPLALFVATTGAGPLSWIQRSGLKSLWTLGIRLTGNDGVILLIAYNIAILAAIWCIVQNGRMAKHVPWETWRYRFLLLWLLLPIFSVFTLSFARPLFLPRYFILCLPPLLLLAAAGLSRIRSPWLLILCVLIFVALSLQGTVSYYHHDFENVERDNWRGASSFILSNAQPGDAVIFHVPMGRMPYEYYHSLRGISSADSVVLYPSHGNQITFLDFVEKPSFGQLDDVIPERQRVWLVLSNTGPSGTDKTAVALEKLIAASHSQSTTYDFTGLEVLLYSTNHTVR